VTILSVQIEVLQKEMALKIGALVIEEQKHDVIVPANDSEPRNWIIRQIISAERIDAINPINL
jgi:hypothetical protein